MITINSIQEASQRIKKYIKRTDLIYAEKLSKKTGKKVYLKLENFQNSGAFKMRGACNKILTLTKKEKDNGVICSSAGNHAQGVANSATMMGIKSTIVMPKGAPVSKVKATQEYGGKVIQYGNVYDEAYSKAVELQRETGATFIHPFDDEKVIEGQGTIGLEILDQIDKVDTVIVPIGGGGLISGIAFILKELKPSIKIVGVQAENAPSMKKAFYSKENKPYSVIPSIADGIAVAKPGKNTFKIISKYVDEIVTVSEDEISETILFLLEKYKLVSEGAGATAVASILSGKVGKKGEKIVAVISGGNIDITLVEKIINKGLISAGRRFEMEVSIKDKNGELLKLIDNITSKGGNIHSINQDNYSNTLDATEQMVKLVIDVKDKEHKQKIEEIFK